MKKNQNSKSVRRLTLLVAPTAALACASLAWSQQSGAGRASAAETVGIEEVVVTARRRVESRQDVPLSVAAVSEEQLAAQGIRQINDLTNKLPNFLVQSGTTNAQGTVTVRGIDAAVRNAGFKSSVSFYVDGVYQGRPLNFNQDLVDIERVELLLGPQGTLFGDNTIAGAVNIVTRRPGDTFGGFAELETGDYGLKALRGSINVPLSDRWAVRFSGAHTQRDGFQTNIATGVGQGDLDRSSGRLQLLGKFGATDVLLIGDYQTGDERPQVVEYSKPATTAGVPNFSGAPFTVSQDDPALSDFSRKSLALKVDHRFDGGGSISSVTAWKNSNSLDRLDQDQGSDARLRSNLQGDETQRLLSQEVRYESDQEKSARWTVGAFFLDDEVELVRTFDYPPPLVVLGPLGALHFRIPTFSLLESTSYAGYANLEFDLNDRLTLGAGLRYSSEDQDVRWQQNEILVAQGGVTSTALAQQLLGPMASGFLVSNAPLYSDSRSDSGVSGTATVSWKFDESRRAYFRYARGSKSGGFNLEPLPAPLPPSRAFNPETLDAYELGFKSQWLDRRLLVNIAAFNQDYRELQRVDVVPLQPVGQTRVIRNAGQVEVKGAEIEIVAAPTRGLQIRAAYGYADSKFKEYRLNNGTDLSGQSLNGAPKWNGSIGLNYVRELSDRTSIFFDASADFRAKRRLGPSDATAVSVAGYEVVDARLGATFGGGAWEIAAWGRNLTDELYVTVRASGNDFYPAGEAVAYGTPRMYGISARYLFGAR